MNRRVIALSLSALFVVISSFSAFAATEGIIKDEKGTRYQNADGSFLTSAWKWIDADKDNKIECYYFDKDGCMAFSITTPDGYTVDELGRWVVDKVVQLTDAIGPGGVNTKVTTANKADNAKMDDYAATLVYKGVDGTETVTARTDSNTIYFDVTSKRPSSELDAIKAKELYYSDDHYAYMYSMACDLMDHFGESREIVETIYTSDGVKVRQYTYYGQP